MKIPLNTVIHQYDATLKERMKTDGFPKRIGRKIIEQLVDGNRNIFPKRPVYDGKKIMYTKEFLYLGGAVSLFLFLFLKIDMCTDKAV